MSDLAQKLKADANSWIVTQSFLFGEVPPEMTQRSLRPQIRIGMWPMQSNSDPELAMGISLMLAALLENWNSVAVYRLMARIDDTVSNYEWDIADSQFSVDDWELDGLDENVAIWGGLSKNNSEFQMWLEVENDALDGDNTLRLDYNADTMASLLGQVRIAATEIMRWIAPTIIKISHTDDDISEIESNHLGALLMHLFKWELGLFLAWSGQVANMDEVRNKAGELITLSQTIGSDLINWLVLRSLTRIVTIDKSDLRDIEQQIVNSISESLIDYPMTLIVLGIITYRSGNLLHAYDLLEANVEHLGANELSWRILGSMYHQNQDLYAAIDTYQRAIEVGTVTDEIYMRYGELTQLFSSQQIKLKPEARHVSGAGRSYKERLLFASPKGDYSQESTLIYEHAVELNPDNIEALARLTNCLIDSNDTTAWGQFSKLIVKDEEGGFVTKIVEELDSDEDIISAIRSLETSRSLASNQLYVYLNLVRAYLAAEELGEASKALELARSINTNPQIFAIIERLNLSIENRDFEHRLGEILDTVDAQRQVSDEDIEFLEMMIEKAPTISLGYRLLAESYLSWDEPDDAVDVLLDSLKHIEHDTENTVLLAKILWDANELELAYGYLDQALMIYPSHPSLLSLKGRFLFDDGKIESARVVLANAELIEPSNIELVATRKHISNKLTEIDDNS